MNCFHACIHAHTHHHVYRTLYTLMFFFYDKPLVHMCMYTFTIACMYSLRTCSCIQSMCSVIANTNICASSTTTDLLMFHELFPCKYSCAYSPSCAQNIVHWMFFFYDKLIVHMCMYTFTIACMYPMHTCSCIHSMFSVHASTDICASSMTTDRLMFHEVFPCKYSCACSSACAHNIVHSNRFLLWQTCSTHVHLHFHHCLHAFTASMFMYSLDVFRSCNYQHLCIVYDNRSMFHQLFPCKYPCAYSSSCAQNIVHSNVFLLWQTRSTHVLVYFHHCCMYSLHACSCIHSMCSVHANTNICASSTTTDLLMFHELFPCKYSCAYSSSCAQNIVHSNVFLLWQTSSTHVHVYFHHCMHVFTAFLFMYSLHVFNACEYRHLCVVHDNRSTDVPWSVSMQILMRILISLCT